MILAAIHTLLHLAPNLVVCWVQVRTVCTVAFLLPQHFNENTIVWTWTLINVLSNNIISWNLVVLSKIHSKTSAHNFIRIHSELAFLSHVVHSRGLLFSWTQCILLCHRGWETRTNYTKSVLCIYSTKCYGYPEDFSLHYDGSFVVLCHLNHCSLYIGSLKNIVHIYHVI